MNSSVKVLFFALVLSSSVRAFGQVIASDFFKFKEGEVQAYRDVETLKCFSTGVMSRVRTEKEKACLDGVDQRVSEHFSNKAYEKLNGENDDGGDDILPGEDKISPDTFYDSLTKEQKGYISNKEKFFKGEGLDKLNCKNLVSKNVDALKQSNDITSIVVGGVTDSSGFENLNECRDESYFKKGKKFYGYTKTFTGLLNENGEALACAKMAMYDQAGVQYSCQSILSQRASCQSTSYSEELLSSDDIKVLVKSLNRRQKVLNELYTKRDEINQEADEANRKNMIRDTLNSYVVLNPIADFPFQERAESFDDIETNYKDELDVFVGRMDKEINQIVGIINKNVVTAEAGGNTFQFRSRDVCEDVLMDQFKACMGDTPSYDPSQASDVVAKKGIKASLIRDNKGREHSALDFDPSKELVVCSDGSCGEKQKEELEVRLSNSYYKQFYKCNSWKHVIGAVDEGKQVQWEPGEYYESFDRRFKCVNTSPWTMDYHSCKAAVTFYDGAAVGTVAMDTANMAIVAGKNNKIQQEALSNSVGGGDQLNTSLNAQAKSLTVREQAETRKAVFSGSKVAGLTTILLSYKTPNKFKRDCVEGQTDLAGGEIHFCVAADSAEGESPNAKEIFANQQVRKEMWSEVAKASVETTLAIMAATQASKQRSDVNKYKKMFEEQKDESNTEGVAVGLDYCKYNPASPQCQNRGPRVSSGGDFAYGNVGLQGQGQNLAITDKDDSFGEYKDETIADGSTDAIDDLGNMIDNSDIGSFGNDFNAPGAGGTTKGTALGGGGGGGGAGGGAGGGGSAPAKAKAGQSNYAVTSTKGAYGKRGGDAKYSGGGSANKKKKSSNPFSKMFGSKSSRNIASDVKDIAPAHSGLFDKISKRYERVATDKRLLDLSKVNK